MEGCYEVYFGNQSAGKVQLIRQGLYYRVICRCRVPGDQVFRLYAVQGNRRENLGVVIPDGDGFSLDKKIPAKNLIEEKIRFILSSAEKVPAGRFEPISPEEPFLYIDRLKTAFLLSEHGKIGIRITENPEA